MMSSKFFTSVPARLRLFLRNRSTEAAKSVIKPEKRKVSVDINDIQHHANLSSTWWDEKGPIGLLHALNSLRVPFIRDGLVNTECKKQDFGSPLKGFKILDVGCGGGILCEPLARLGAKMTGIDAGIELITIAQLHAGSDPNLLQTLTYECTTIEEHAEKNVEFYDAIVCSEVLEHVNNKALFLKSCISALKPGGSIFISTFNTTFASWFNTIILAEHVLGLIAPGTHQWDKFISPADTEYLLEACGCKIKLIRGMSINLLTGKWFWMSSTAYSYALHAVKQEVP